MLHITRCDDGDVLIEFIAKEFRTGIVLSDKQDECSWYIVGKEGVVLPDIMQGGCISDNAIDLLTDWATRIRGCNGVW